ncbi:hypothetical protein [Sphingobium yanoikuyae]|uniref:hypothetical protein n=1 Tax=Sphingobium yanoikuyae TaxID=13690 RepID=UPI00345E0AEB
MRNLTKTERATLDKAEALLISLLDQREETLMLSIHHGWEDFSITYFDPNGLQHSNNSGDYPAGDDMATLSGKVQHALDIKASVFGAVPDLKEQRIKKLRAELSRLTGEVA